MNKENHPIYKYGKHAAQGDGKKESFKPSGSENRGGNAPRQDGKNSKDHVNAADHGWKLEHSQTQGPIDC